MKITLTNGTELNPIVVTGGKHYIQGVNRDGLSFVFPAEVGMDTLDKLFTAANCESITIEEDGGASFIHKGYTVRAGLSKESLEVSPANAEMEAIYEDRITVTMAERTYMESQMASLTETVDVLVMESLMG